MSRLLQLNVAPRYVPLCIVLLLCCCIGSAYANRTTNHYRFQERTVTGRITSSDDGQGFPGVNIIVKGTTRGTVTDTDGNFRIEVPSQESVLVFSSIGYKTTEVVVGAQSNINLSLQPDVTALAEVVVVGYGTVKKSDVTGALSSVSSEKLQAVPVQNISQALQGRAAGVDVVQNGFKPGDNPRIRVRGNRSVNSSNDPLIVLDGIPLAEGSGMNDFNPADVASIEVLKDASATAIYGSRGANGVILVTTKRGKSGKAVITYDGYAGFSRPLAEVETMTGGRHAEMRREAYRNDSGKSYNPYWPDVTNDIATFTDPFVWESVKQGYTWADEANNIPVMRPVTAEEREMYEKYYQYDLLRYPNPSAAIQAKLNAMRALLDDPNLQIPVYDASQVRTTDWRDLVMRTGSRQSHNVSVSGGGDKINVSFSLGYYNEKGLQKDLDFNRYNTQLTLDYNVSDAFKIGGTVSASHTINNSGSNAYFSAVGQLPYAIPFDPATGNIIRNPGSDPLIFNPLNDLSGEVNEDRYTRVFGSYYAELKLFEGLKFRTNFGPDFRQNRFGDYYTSASNERDGAPPLARYNQEQRFAYVMENLLFYDKDFNGVHNLGITLLHSVQQDRYERSEITVSNLPYDYQHWYNLESTINTGADNFLSNYNRRRLRSYMGRINYTFDNKYLLTITGRVDGSNVLAAGNRIDFFPSMAVAWKMHEESFLSGINAINELKLRAGYGITGQQGISNPYITQGAVERRPYTFGANAAWGFVPSEIANSTLSWEKTASLNIGLDFGLMDGRIAGSVEVYDQKTRDLLLARTLPTVSGFRSILTNVGKTRNRGIEVSLNTVNVELSNSFKWTTDIIFQKNKEEWVETSYGAVDDVANNWFIGQPIVSYYDYVPDGVLQWEDQDKAAAYGRIVGQNMVKDLNPDGVINAEDRAVRGSDVPKWSGSLVNTFSYKGIELSAFLYTRQGSTIGSGYYRPALAGRYPEAEFIDYWTPANPSNAYPRPRRDQERLDYTEAYLWQDGSFVKLRTINLAYNLPVNLISKFKMSNVKVYVTATNPFLWTDFKGGDPEYSRGNYDRNNLNPTVAYPLSIKTYVFGIRASF